MSKSLADGSIEDSKDSNTEKESSTGLLSCTLDKTMGERFMESSAGRRDKLIEIVPPDSN